MKRTLEFNRNNWTGKSISVEIVDNKFELFDYKFELKICDEKEVAILYGDNWSDFVMKGFKIDDEWIFNSAGIVRENKNPFIACIQVLCNVI